MKKVRRFKFVREGLRSERGGYQWELGKWHKTECVELCHGFNCSDRILDALGYVQGEILGEVEAKAGTLFFTGAPGNYTVTPGATAGAKPLPDYSQLMPDPVKPTQVDFSAKK